MLASVSVVDTSATFKRLERYCRIHCPLFYKVVRYECYLDLGIEFTWRNIALVDRTEFVGYKDLHDVLRRFDLDRKGDSSDA